MHDPTETRVRMVAEVAEVGQSGSQVIRSDAEQLDVREFLPENRQGCSPLRSRLRADVVPDYRRS